MPVITTSGGKQFSALDGEPLLAAALRHGIALEYSCQTGRCSTCKARLLNNGSTIALHDEVGLSQPERDAGWILTCVRTAHSDVSLDVQDLGDVPIFPPKTLPCRIQTLERLSADVLKVVLRLPPNNEFTYHPGQYIDVIGHGGLRRSYSIANAPATAKQLELHVRQVPGGAMSDYWFGQARTNDLLRLNGPLGTFFLRDVAELDLVFLATGTGIAPIKAMLEGLASTPHQFRPRSIAVYWGGRVSQDLYWEPATVDVEHRFIPVLSRASGDWHGARGYVQQTLLAHTPELQQAAVHACGSNAMIHSARKQLIDAGLPERRFHSDAFVCSAAV